MFNTQFILDPAFTIPFVFGVLAVNVLLLVVFIIVSSSFFKRIVLSQQEAEKIRETARREAEILISHAREEALAVVSKSNVAVEEMLKEIHAASLDTQKRIEQKYEFFVGQETERLAKGAQELLRTYEDVGLATKSSYRKTAEAIESAIMKQIQDAIAAFQHTLEEEVKNFRVSAEERTHEWQKRAQEEIDVYKRESLKKIDESLYRIISFIAKEVIGHALDLDGQQELVMRALETAKKEGFFKS